MKTSVCAKLGGGVTALAALLLAACSGGGSGSVPAAAPPIAAATAAPAAVAPVAYASALLAGAQRVGAASFTTRTIDVVTNPADESALYAYASAVSQPGSPVFHQFLTPQQIADRFGPSASAYAAAQAYFQHLGLTTHGYQQRSEIAITGTQSQLEAALNTTFGRYQAGGTTFVALDTAPRLPASLHVSGVRNAVGIEPQIGPLPNPEGASSSLYQSLKPQQVQRALDFTGAYAAGFTGSGVTVAVLGTGQTTPNDVAGITSRYGVPVAQLVYKPVPAASAPPTISPLSGGCTTQDNYAVSPPCIADGGEARIDTQTIAMLAPSATMLYYLGYQYVGASTNWGPDSIAELNQIASDNLADVVSMSVGSCETDRTPAMQTAIATLAAQGVAIFASAGDNAVWPGGSCRNTYKPGVSYPAVDPNVVAVGAVYLPVDAAGNLTGQIVPWGFQDTNGSNGGNAAGSGGGYSTVYTPPPFQSVIPPPLNTGFRMVPDVMMDGDPHSSLANIAYAGFGGPVYGSSNGTSEAAPEAAAAWAIVLQACRQSSACAATLNANGRAGNPNAYYYGIYAGTGPNAGRNGMTYGNVFYDVTYGNNTVQPGWPVPATAGPATAPPYIFGFTAGPGYDLASGLGVPLVGPLIRAVAGITSVP